MEEVFILILLLSAGGFIKIFTTLQIFRVGIGLYGGAMGILVFVIAFLFSFFIYQKSFDGEAVLVENQKGNPFVLSKSTQEKLTPFLKENAEERDIESLKILEEKFQGSESGKEKTESFSTLLLAFTLSELREAFQLGLLFILPFLIIDIVVVHILQLLSVTQIASWSLALPLKLLLFLAVDGWGLISQRLIGSYLGG